VKTLLADDGAVRDVTKPWLEGILEDKKRKQCSNCSVDLPQNAQTDARVRTRG